MPMLGFTPGLPSETPGIITDCENFIPYDVGMEAAPSLAAVSATVCPATAIGAVTVKKLDGTNRTFVGTPTKLYELSAGNWVDVSQSASAYVSGSTWSFAQFGDATLASNYGNAIQASSASSFSAIVGAPAAKIVETVVTGGGGFCFAFNTNDASYGVSPDRWWCSAVNDHTSWTVNAATQATTGRLIGPGGEIVAAKKFGADSVVAYKTESMFHGRYIGGATVWAFQEIPEVGAVGPRAVANLGYAHFIVSKDGFWVYDGARPVQVGTAEVQQWFITNSTALNLNLTEVAFEKERNRVWVFFCYGGSSTLNRALVYHIGTQRWGLVTVDIETTMTYIGSGITFDGMSGTFADQVDAYDSPYWTAASRSLAAFTRTTHAMKTFTGTPGASYFTSSDVGDPSKASRLTEAYLNYAFRPTTATCTAYGSFALGGTETVGPTVSAYDEIGSAQTPGRFTLRNYARWHRMEFRFTGPARVTGYAAKLMATGSR